MSMLDAFFNKGFKGAKCKTLLKLTIPRIKLLRNRREIQLKQMRRDIAKLLENGLEATARIRVEHIIREENMMAAQEIIELFCELIAVRLPIIETQRECPIDLKEAISSICFAAPRCSDLPELQQVQMLFAAKYGKEFVAAATELMPDSGVNRQIIELLSIRPPSVEAKLKLLKEIAEEHEVDWDPAASETEFFKPHEDLLNGPDHIIGGSTLLLPKEKHDDSISSEHTEEYHEEPDSDAGFDSLDLPEVPKVSVRATSDVPSAPEISPSRLEHSPPHHYDLGSEFVKSTAANDAESEVNNPDPSIPTTENKQFHYDLGSEFVKSTATNDAESEVNNSDPSIPTTENKQFQFIPFVASPPPPPPPFWLPSEQSVPIPSLPRDPTPSLPPTISEANVDFQDVLAAAQAAAETADRAATAARAAASLAQVRITELISKKNISRISDSSEKNGSPAGSVTQDFSGKPTFDQQNSFDHTDQIPHYEPSWGLGLQTLSSDGSPEAKDHTHQPQRSVSLEDDPYFAYPNLFTRQDSEHIPGAHSSDEHSRSAHGF